MSPGNEFYDSVGANRIALFVDTENFLGAMNTSGQSLTLAPILNKLRQIGRLSIGRSFADLESCCRLYEQRSTVRKMLQKELIEIRDVPHLTNAKNTADICLVVDAISVAFQHPEINCFAIVSSDRDYMPLVGKLKELGKIVIGIGNSSNTNPVYVKSFDFFFYFDHLMAETEGATTHQADNFGLTEESVKNKRSDYCDLLCEAAVAVSGKGQKCVGTAVTQMMRQLRPDFELSLSQFKSMRELADFAEKKGLVKITDFGGDFLVTLQNIDKKEKPLNKPLESHSSIAKKYRKFVEEKLKSPLPSIIERKQIFKEVQEAFNAPRAKRAITLIEINNEVDSRLKKSGNPLPQAMIFKTIFSLYKAGCFWTEPFEQYNPIITYLIKEMEEWDEGFLKTIIGAIRFDHPKMEIVPEAISILFFGDEEHTNEIKRILEL